MYKEIYQLATRIPKRDRYGIHAQIENMCLEMITLSIESSLTPKQNKVQPLETLRTKTEVIKQLIRIANEVNVYTDKTYMVLQERLQEISKMTNGWLKYVKQNPA